MKTQIEMIELLKAGHVKHYSKSGVFPFLIHKGPSAEIVTSIAGVTETKNVANEGDYILTGAEGEKYVIKPETFAKRYKVLSPDQHPLLGKAQATGECWGIEFEGDPQLFISPWTEPMSINPGDMLVSPDKDFSQAYRIERNAFNKTYTLTNE